MKGPHWSANEISELRAMMAVGFPPQAIADRLGRTRQAVWRKARKLTVGRRVKAIPMTPAQHERLIRLIAIVRASFPSDCAFERESGIARMTIKRIIKGQRAVFASTVRTIEQMAKGLSQ